ncbi:MAG: hypothetical protein SVW77_03135 [Candidatus Nanohaloarchaea archaeon]|nr:hypothetical protein [Candidatus Nanohaloarchaea archaeon]
MDSIWRLLHGLLPDNRQEDLFPSDREMAIESLGSSIVNRLERHYAGHKENPFTWRSGETSSLGIYATGRDDPFYEVRFDEDREAMHIDSVRRSREQYGSPERPEFSDAVAVIEDALVNSNLPYEEFRDLQELYEDQTNH